MKHLLTAILCVICAVYSTVAQHVKPFVFTSKQTKNIARHTVLPRNTFTKRLSGESSISSTLPSHALESADSIRYLYDDQNRVNERQNRTFENGSWALKTRSLYLTFDNAGNPTLEIFQRSTDNGATWNDEIRFTATYDASGRATNTTDQYWDDVAGDWGPPSAYQYEYDQHGNLISTSSPTYYTLSQYTYNQDGFPVNILESYSNGVDGWVFFYQQQFVYDTIHPGLPIHSISLEYTVADSSWAYVDSTAYTYDSIGNLILRDYFPTTIDPEWDCPLVHRLIQTFDNQNRLSFEEYYDACQGDSIPNWRHVYTIERDYDVDGDPLLVLETGYYPPDSTLISKRYTYETVSEALEPTAANTFVFYPNPVSTAIFLKATLGGLQSAKIFDTQGRLVQTRVLQGIDSETLTLAGIPPGNYILQVIGKDGKTSAKPFAIGK